MTITAEFFGNYGIRSAETLRTHRQLPIGKL
jgi:hypothetical protein